VDSGWRISVDAREGGRPQRLTLTWPAEVVASAWRTVTIRLLLDPQDPAAGAAGAR